LIFDFPQRLGDFREKSLITANLDQRRFKIAVPRLGSVKGFPSPTNDFFDVPLFFTNLRKDIPWSREDADEFVEERFVKKPAVRHNARRGEGCGAGRNFDRITSWMPSAIAKLNVRM